MDKDTFYRGRRLRMTPVLRELCEQIDFFPNSKLIMPYFVLDTDDNNFSRQIPSMPGQYQLSPKMLLERVAKYVDIGLSAVLLFGIPRRKDEFASEAYDDTGVIQRTVSLLKDKFPNLLIITDVCLCEYMKHGHCGILKPNGEIDNDTTLPLLAKTAVSHARSGADIIAPSDMMDGRIYAIRSALDENGFKHIPIMSYAIKYASSFYGPFREAAESAPSCGDRKSYQMNPANAREALLEAKADLEEGADMLIVKPAGPYSDIIRLTRENINVPIAAYQVSGEYSMIRAAGLNGWINEDAVIRESILGIRRAGADILISYFTEKLLEKGLRK